MIGNKAYVVLVLLERLHLSEQYLTSCQVFSHFFRQAKLKPQTGHVFSGKFCFLTPRMMCDL